MLDYMLEVSLLCMQPISNEYKNRWRPNYTSAGRVRLTLTSRGPTSSIEEYAGHNINLFKRIAVVSSRLMTRCSEVQPDSQMPG